MTPCARPIKTRPFGVLLLRRLARGRKKGQLVVNLAKKEQALGERQHKDVEPTVVRSGDIERRMYDFVRHQGGVPLCLLTCRNL